MRHMQLQQLPNQLRNVVAGAWDNFFKRLKGLLKVLQQNLAPNQPETQPNLFRLSGEGS